MSEYNSIEQCISHIATGDIEALEWIFIRLKVELMAVVFAVLGDVELAADAVQETMLRVLESSALFKPGTNGRVWISTMHGLQRYTYKEIAENLSMKEGTVRSKYSRIMRKLREKFSEGLEAVNER